VALLLINNRFPRNHVEEVYLTDYNPMEQADHCLSILRGIENPIETDFDYLRR
jgi:hypothetical protein